MEQSIIGHLDMAEIEKKANEYAQEGALKCLKEFYTGYNSPFLKAIEEKLEGKKLEWQFELPDIIATLNDAISAEIDTIANKAVAKSFVPLVKNLLVRENKEIKFSEILKEYIEAVDDSDADIDSFCCETKRDADHGWIHCKLICDYKYAFKFTLHEQKQKGGPSKYKLFTLPNCCDSEFRSEKMKISLDGATLELPFTRDILKDKFTSYLARIVLAGSLITMDCNDFQDDMFNREEY